MKVGVERRVTDRLGESKTRKELVLKMGVN